LGDPGLTTSRSWVRASPGRVTLGVAVLVTLVVEALLVGGGGIGATLDSPDPHSLCVGPASVRIGALVSGVAAIATIAFVIASRPPHEPPVA
jgi:hypothetical protein